MSGSEEPRNVLRAKYHDYCSAQVADLLVYMSPDEIYLLAHRAYREEGRTDEISYAEMVKVATDWLAERIALPPFEVWAEDYRRNPDRYEEYFMGLWQSELADPDAERDPDEEGEPGSGRPPTDVEGREPSEDGQEPADEPAGSG